MEFQLVCAVYYPITLVLLCLPAQHRSERVTKAVDYFFTTIVMPFAFIVFVLYYSLMLYDPRLLTTNEKHTLWSWYDFLIVSLRLC